VSLLVQSAVFESAPNHSNDDKPRVVLLHLAADSSRALAVVKSVIWICYRLQVLSELRLKSATYLIHWDYSQELLLYTVRRTRKFKQILLHNVYLLIGVFLIRVSGSTVHSNFIDDNTRCYTQCNRIFDLVISHFAWWVNPLANSRDNFELLHFSEWLIHAVNNLSMLFLCSVVQRSLLHVVRWLKNIKCLSMFHDLLLPTDSCSVTEQFSAVLSNHHCSLCTDMLSILGIGEYCTTLYFSCI